MVLRTWRVGRRAIVIWSDRQVSASAAAVAFFAVLSLAPTLVFATTAATRWLGEEASRQLTIERLEQFAGPESAELARSVLDSAWYERFSAQSISANLPSAVLLIFGASGVFVQLRRALEKIFGRTKATGSQAAVAWLIGRVLATSGAVVGGLAFVASLVGSLLLQTAAGWMSSTLGVSESTWSFAATPATLVLIFAVFLAVYAGLTLKRPSMRCLLIGAATAALGFELGRRVFAAYVSLSLIATAYGPASSLVAFLLWMFYTANIVLFGAVVSQAIADESTD